MTNSSKPYMSDDVTVILLYNIQFENSFVQNWFTEKIAHKVSKCITLSYTHLMKTIFRFHILFPKWSVHIYIQKMLMYKTANCSKRKKKTWKINIKINELKQFSKCITDLGALFSCQHHIETPNIIIPFWSCYIWR